MSGNNFESTEKKLCPYCGAEVTGNFCSNCGTKLEQEKKQEETKIEHSENDRNTSNICQNCKEKPSNEKAKRKYRAVKYIAFVLVISVAMFAIFNAAKCKHKDYLLYENYNKATCQQQAVDKYVCEHCGKVWTEDTGEYGKHKYNPTGEKTERGDEYICEVCGEYWYYKTSQTQGSDKKTATSNSTTTNKIARPLTDEEICVCATDIVEKNMYNPSSARFCLFSEMDITRFDDNSYLVMGWVEGTNGYGATVRQTFLVNFKVTLNEHGNEIYTDAECTFM